MRGETDEEIMGKSSKMRWNATGSFDVRTQAPIYNGRSFSFVHIWIIENSFQTIPRKRSETSNLTKLDGHGITSRERYHIASTGRDRSHPFCHHWFIKI